jgi:WD40 repeat protein
MRCKAPVPLDACLPACLQVWSVPAQKFLFCLSGHTNWVRTCQLSPDARLAVSGSDDKTVRVWDLETRTAVHTFEELDGVVHVAKFHPDGGWALARCIRCSHAACDLVLCCSLRGIML